MKSPLVLNILFHIGPVPITEPVLITWAIMALLVGGAWLATASFRSIRRAFRRFSN